MKPLVEYREVHGVAHISLDRPEKLNAIDQATADELHACFADFEAGSARVAILRGEGRAFCAGADRKDPPAELWRCIPGLGSAITKPMIAVVQGHAVGAGYLLAQACDLVVAESTCVMSYPEARLGVFGGIGGSIATRIPTKAAAEFLMLGRPFAADRALAAGMVNEVVEPGAGMAAAEQMAADLVASDPEVLAVMKSMIAEAVVSPVESSMLMRRLLQYTSQTSRLTS